MLCLLYFLFMEAFQFFVNYMRLSKKEQTCNRKTRDTIDGKMYDDKTFQ